MVNGSLRGAKEQRSFKPQAAGSIPAGRTTSSQGQAQGEARAAAVRDDAGRADISVVEVKACPRRSAVQRLSPISTSSVQLAQRPVNRAPEPGPAGDAIGASVGDASLEYPCISSHCTLAKGIAFDRSVPPLTFRVKHDLYVPAGEAFPPTRIETRVV